MKPTGTACVARRDDRWARWGLRSRPPPRLHHSPPGLAQDQGWWVACSPALPASGHTSLWKWASDTSQSEVSPPFFLLTKPEVLFLLASLPRGWVFWARSPGEKGACGVAAAGEGEGKRSLHLLKHFKLRARPSRPRLWSQLRRSPCCPQSTPPPSPLMMLPAARPRGRAPAKRGSSPPCPAQLLVRKAGRDISIYRRIKCLVGSDTHTLSPIFSGVLFSQQLLLPGLGTC